VEISTQIEQPEHSQQYGFLTEQTIRKIEENIAAKLNHKGIKPTTIFWDTTNVFTYIESGEELPQKGRSKEKRHDKNS